MRWKILVVLLCAAAGPAIRPTTRPDDVAVLSDRLVQAQAAYAHAQESAFARLSAREDFKRAQADLHTKESALEAARANGSAQQRLDASAAFNRARAAVEK